MDSQNFHAVLHHLAPKAIGHKYHEPVHNKSVYWLEGRIQPWWTLPLLPLSTT